MATAVRVITNNNGAYTIPADFAAGSSLQVECIGSSGAGNYGGGAYSKTNAITGLAAGNTVYIRAGGAGSGVDSWFNKAANSAPASTTNGCLAKAGTSSGTNSPPGGQSSAGIGDLKYSGGTGGLYLIGCPNDSFGGGGGAAGPNGAGANAYQTGYGGGGGGANGGSASVAGGAGGNGRGGSGGGAYNASGNAGNGTNGGGGGGTSFGTGGGGGPDLVFTDTVTGVSWGPCGGSGGAVTGGGNYGGGACRLSDVGLSGAASQGIVVLTYTTTAAAASTSNFLMFF
jgi:hypothetical protein